MLFHEKMNIAAEKGDFEAVEALREEMFESQALKAFETGTTETLENLYKQEIAKDPNEVGQEHIDNAKQALKDLQTLEGVYKDNC